MMVKRMENNKLILSLTVSLDALEEEYDALCGQISALKTQNTDPNANEYYELNEKLTKLKAEIVMVCAKLNEVKA